MSRNICTYRNCFHSTCPTCDHTIFPHAISHIKVKKTQTNYLFSALVFACSTLGKGAVDVAGLLLGSASFPCSVSVCFLRAVIGAQSVLTTFFVTFSGILPDNLTAMGEDTVDGRLVFGVIPTARRFFYFNFFLKRTLIVLY